MLPIVCVLWILRVMVDKTRCCFKIRIVLWGAGDYQREADLHVSQ